MGLRSRRVFAAATDSQVLESAVDFQGLLTSVENPINMSVLRIGPRQAGDIEQFGVVQFIDKEKRFKVPPAQVTNSFGAIPFAGEDQVAFRDSLLLDANLALAVVLSSHIGRALYVVHSDSYCSSGYISFEAGKPREGLIYGWEGDEVLVEIRDNSVNTSALSVEQTKYGKYASLGVDKYLEPGASYESYLSRFDYSSKSIVRYQLMLQKQLIQSVLPGAF